MTGALRRERALGRWRLSRRTLAWRVGLLLGALGYLAGLVALYAFYISPRFAYLGYELHPAPAAYQAAAWLLALLPALWLPLALERPSQLAYWLLYLLALAPSVLVPFYTLSAPPLQVLAVALALTLAFAGLGLIYRLPVMRLPRLRYPALLFWLGLLGLATAFLAVIVARFGLRLELPALAEVYDTRAEYADELAGAGPLVGYAVGWLANVIGPFLIAAGFLALRLPLIGVGLVLQLLVFSITGFKSVLFSSMLLAALALALRRGGRHVGAWLMGGALLLLGGTWLLDQLTGQLIFTSYFVRRLIVTPGLIAGLFFEFFSSHPKALLGHSVLAPLVHYPYDATPPRVIAQAYFGRDFSANANLWADGFANFGFAGIFGFTLLLGAVLYLFDALAARRGLRQRLLIAYLLGLPAFTLANSALLTSLLTHGIAFAFVLLYAVPPTLFAARLGRRRRPHWRLRGRRRA